MEASSIGSNLNDPNMSQGNGRTTNPWSLYDTLIDGLPDDGAMGTVESCAIAPIWTYVRTSAGRFGLAMTPLDQYQPIGLRGRVTGMAARDLAREIKSWNVHQAALGHAAINSWCNQLERIPADDPRVIVGRPGARRGASGSGSPSGPDLSVDRPAASEKSAASDKPAGLRVLGGFGALVAGKKVAIIGHAKHMLSMGEICQLTVLERVMQEGDVPDPACEYLLPEQDYVFITGSSFTNKTAPRLIELCRPCRTILWGPSVPLTEALFGYGVDAMLGQVTTDPAEVARIVCEGGVSTDFMHVVTPVTWFADEGFAQEYRDAVETLGM